MYNLALILRVVMGSKTTLHFLPSGSLDLALL